MVFVRFVAYVLIILCHVIHDKCRVHLGKLWITRICHSELSEESVIIHAEGSSRLLEMTLVQGF